MRYKTLFLVAIILALSIPHISAQNSPSTRFIPNIGFVPNRLVSFTIKIVFLGLTKTDLNLTYLTSNVTSLPFKYQAILAGPLDTGVIYSFHYELVFADNSTVFKFASFLSRIGIEQDTTVGGPAGPYVLTNPYFDNSSSLVGTVKNYFYDAARVESWLAANVTIFGGNPVPGYTVFIADLHHFLPSFSYQNYTSYRTQCGIPCSSRVSVNAHYYNRTVTDPDLGLVMTRHYMTGWGGNERFYYLDLSSGPSYWTNELPIEVASQLRAINVNSYYGKLWTSKFVGSYVFGAVENLFAADQLYPVNYSQHYNVQLFVVDNRTSSEKVSGPKLTATLNRTYVQTQLANLLAFATVTVNVKFANVTDYPQLASIMANATTNVRDPSSGRPIVDGDLVYNWFTTSGLGHITQFVNPVRTTAEIDIPGFIFALKGSYTFGVPFKEDIATPNNFGTFGGEALGDMVLMGFSEQADFTAGNNATLYNQPGKGVGFTHAAVHELGHMLGLNHPFIYDLTEDFTNTFMAYYSYGLTFSQFDKDTILRGVNDDLLTFAQQTLASTTSNIFNSGSISLAEQNMAKANQLYNSMDYAGAVPYSYNAAVDAFSAQQSAGGGILSPALVFGLIGVVVGVGVGLLLGYFIFKKRTVSSSGYNRCPTCQQPLRWDPAQMRWYCDKCQKPA